MVIVLYYNIDFQVIQVEPRSCRSRWLNYIYGQN